MYTIAIDAPNIYQAGEIFASENHSSLQEMVNKYVAELAAKVLSRKDNYVPITKTEKFKNTMKALDAFVVDDLKTPVPADEDGKGAIARVKYSATTACSFL